MHCLFAFCKGELEQQDPTDVHLWGYEVSDIHSVLMKIKRMSRTMIKNRVVCVAHGFCKSVYPLNLPRAFTEFPNKFDVGKASESLLAASRE